MRALKHAAVQIDDHRVGLGHLLIGKGAGRDVDFPLDAVKDGQIAAGGGEEPVGIACRSGKAKLLLVAKDAGDHTFRRARSFVSGSKCPYVCVPYTKDELGDGLGCNACALCAFTEPAFAKSFLEALGDETHADILAQLTVQTQRVQKRRQEAQAHRKNVKMGKK